MKISEIPTPAYVLDEEKLTRNLEILKSVQERTGCKILLAQKAFSMFCEYPLIGTLSEGNNRQRSAMRQNWAGKRWEKRIMFLRLLIRRRRLMRLPGFVIM